MTKVNLSELVAGPEDEALRLELEDLMLQYEALKRMHVQKVRAAAELAAHASIAVAESSVVQAQVELKLIQLLKFGARFSVKVEREPMWMPPFRAPDNSIVIESPATESDSRISVHSSHANMIEVAKDRGVDISSLFGAAED